MGSKVKVTADQAARMVGHGADCVLLLNKATKELGVPPSMQNSMMFMALTAAMALMLETAVQADIIDDEVAAEMVDEISEEIDGLRAVVLETLVLLHRERKLPPAVQAMMDEGGLH